MSLDLTRKRIGLIKIYNFSIAMNYYPPEWEDEDRMRVLLSAMPQDEVAKKSRITFWSSAINRWSNITNSFLFTAQEVSDAFTKGTLVPKCLPEVILHLVSTGDICDINNLNKLCSDNRESWVTWGRRVFVTTPSQWAWDQMKQLLKSNTLSNIQLVNVKVLQEKADETYNNYWKTNTNMEENVLSVLQLYHIVSDVVGTVDNLQIIVEYLVMKNRATVITYKDTTLIKLATPGSKHRPVISEADIAHQRLNTSKQNLENEIESLTSECTKLQTQAKEALKIGLKQQALSLLRRKKKIESSITKLTATLENVTACQLQLCEANINKQVVQTFHTSVSALKTLVSGDLSADSVAATMDDIQEVLEECEDTSNLLSTGVPFNISDDDLDQELEDLLSDKLNVNDQSYYDLPEVPNNIPEILNSSRTSENANLKHKSADVSM